MLANGQTAALASLVQYEPISGDNLRRNPARHGKCSEHGVVEPHEL